MEFDFNKDKNKLLLKERGRNFPRCHFFYWKKRSIGRFSAP